LTLTPSALSVYDCPDVLDASYAKESKNLTSLKFLCICDLSTLRLLLDLAGDLILLVAGSFIDDTAESSPSLLMSVLEEECPDNLTSCPSCGWEAF